MKLKEFMRLLKIPILLIGGTIIIFSLLSYFFGFQLILIKDRSLITWVIYKVFYHLDITHDYAFASLFMSFVILICAMGLFLIGFGDREKLKINSARQVIIKLFSVIMLFLAMDEILCLREQLGRRLEYATGLFDKTVIEHQGFSWLLIYIPLALVGMVLFISIFNNLIKNIRSVKQRTLTFHYFRAVIILVPIYFILVWGEGYLLMTGHPAYLILYVEQFIKLGMIFCAYSLLLKVADSYNL